MIVPQSSGRMWYAVCAAEEQPHVHVERDENSAKFWLNPVRLQSSGGFKRMSTRPNKRIQTTARGARRG